MKRSSFVASAAALAAAGFLCDVSLAAESGAPGSEFQALLETILPFGAPSFPAVPVAVVEQRISAMFGIPGAPAFAASLGGFADIYAFAGGSEQLFIAEASLAPGVDVKQLAARDAAAFADAGLDAKGTFRELGATERMKYVRLWSQSALVMRRRFYTSVRAVSYVAFYSMPEAWKAIDYAGPILGAHA